jgi:hypothetical protein
MPGEEAYDDLCRAESYEDYDYGEGPDYGDPFPLAAPAATIGHNQPPSFEEEIRAEHAAVFRAVADLEAAYDKLPAAVGSEADLALTSKFVVDLGAVVKKVDKAHKDAKAPLKEKVDVIDGLFLSKGLKGRLEAWNAAVRRRNDAWQTEQNRLRRIAAEEEAKRLREAEAARIAEAEALAAQGQHRVAEVVEAQAVHLAEAAQAVAQTAEAAVKDVVRTTTGAGVTVGGRTVWEFEIEDAAKIDLNLLRSVILDHELEGFVSRFVNRGGQALPGVRIYETVKATYGRR